MAGARIAITIDDAEVKAALGRIQAAGKDLRPLFERIGPSMVLSTQNRIERETGPDGKKWTPHARSTVKRRGPGAPILRDTVRLYNSLTFNVEPAYLEWGTNVVYGAIHQLGGTIDHYARSQMAHFAQAKEGAYTKKDGTKVGSRWRFVKASSRRKGKVTKPITIGEHSVTIPARPYLGLDESDKKLILEEAEAYLREAAGGVE